MNAPAFLAFPKTRFCKRKFSRRRIAWLPADVESADSFGKDPPNATVSALGKDASTIRDAVVVLKSPKLDGDKLTFDVQVPKET
jgi:hypothetical protein